MANEIQRFKFNDTLVDGDFTITANSLTTAGIDYSDADDAAVIQAALEAELGSGNVSVSYSAPWITIEFIGALANTDIATITVDDSGLLSPAEDLKVYAKFDGDYLDSSGHGYNLSGGVGVPLTTGSGGMVGESADCTGYEVSYSPGIVIPSGGSFRMFCWFSKTDNDSYMPGPITTWNGGAQPGVAPENSASAIDPPNGDPTYISAALAHGSYTYTYNGTFGPLTAGVWYFLVMYYNATTGKFGLSINGVADEVSVSPHSGGTVNFQVGGGGDLSGGFRGKIDICGFVMGEDDSFELACYASGSGAQPEFRDEPGVTIETTQEGSAGGGATITPAHFHHYRRLMAAA